jgi:hypothetical protein
MTGLRISPDLDLPTDVVTSTSVVFGGKGMGKTNLGSVLVEELTKRRLRWAFLDPMGVAWGLRHSKDGKGPGIECVILGGIHGDIPIEPTSGDVVADLVVDEPVNTIIDFSRNAAGVPWSKGEKIKFVTAYVNRLFRRQGEMIGRERREPLLQIIDEAARYIPQVIPHGDPGLAQCVGAWEQAAEEGRNIGLGVCFLTQRSARINKSVSELADVMFAFRTVGPNSVDAIIDWLGEHMEKTRARELAGKIRELDVGQCLVVSPGWLKVSDRVVQIRERETFDSSATPKPGERSRRVSGQAAKPDLAKYQARMAETIEKAKADDPKILRSRIAALEKQVATGQSSKAGQTSAPAKIEVKVVEKPVFAPNDIAALERLVDRVVQERAGIADRWGKLENGLSVLVAIAKKMVDEKHSHSIARNIPNRPVVSTSQQVTPPRPVAQIAPRKVPAVPSDSGDAAFTPAMRRVLDAVAWWEAAGVEQPTRHQVAFVARYTVNGHFNNLVGALRTCGLVHYPGGATIALTPDGRGAAMAPAAAPTRDELIDRVTTVLKGESVRKIFAVVVEASPNAIARSELAERTGYTVNGHFNNMVGSLKSLGVIDYPGNATVVLSDLFEAVS